MFYTKHLSMRYTHSVQYMPTTTELTHAYLNSHPSIKDCLSYGIINYSKLSRKIAIDLDIEKQTTIEAILIACRRFTHKLQQKTIREQQIRMILQKSELEIKNKILVAIIDKNVYIQNLLSIEKKIRSKADMFYAIEGTKVFTLILSQKYQEELIHLFGDRIIKQTTHLAMITIKSPKDLEKTPGVIAYITSLLGEHDINVVESMSCWTDTIYVVSEEDIPKIMKFLTF